MSEFLRSLLELIGLKADAEADAESLERQRLQRLPMGGAPQRLDDVVKWCAENGHTEPFIKGLWWWAFPLNGVMPVPIGSASLLECGSNY